MPGVHFAILGKSCVLENSLIVNKQAFFEFSQVRNRDLSLSSRFVEVEPKDKCIGARFCVDNISAITAGEWSLLITTRH